MVVGIQRSHRRMAIPLMSKRLVAEYLSRFPQFPHGGKGEFEEIEKTEPTYISQQTKDFLQRK